MGKIRIKKEYFFVFGLLFLAAMNFQAKFFYFIYAAFIVLLLSKLRLKVNRASIPYILFGVLMGIYNIDEGLLSVFRCLTYVLSFIIGSNMILSTSSNRIGDEDNFEHQTKIGHKILTVICWGSFVHFMLNFFYNLQWTLGRNTNDIWTGERLSATIQASLACMMTGLCISMIISPKNKFSRVLYIISAVGILMYNLVLSGRTLPLMMIVVLIIGLVYFYKNSENLSHKLKTTLIIASILGLITLAIIFNVGGIKDYILESNFFDRLFNSKQDALLSGERSYRKIMFLQNMWKYPFGGLHMRAQFGYAHDLLLDAYDEYGFLSIIFLLLILGFGIYNLIVFCKNKDISISCRLSFLCVYITILCEFYIEPILEGLPWLFVCYCLLNGCIYGLNSAYLEKSHNRGVACEDIAN